MADGTPVAARAPASARVAGGGGDLAALVPIAAILLACGLWPLARLFLEALGPDEAGRPLGLLRDVWDSRGFRRAARNTVTASSASVLVSAVLGGGLALATGLLRVRGRAAMTVFALSPLIVPSQIMALAWIELAGSTSPVLGPLGLAPPPGTPNPLYSGGGIALLMGIEHMPFTFLAVRAALATLPADLVEAARIHAIPAWRIALRVALPVAWPGLLAGSALAFAAAVGNFGVPALLGIPGRFPMLTTLIYQRLNGFGPAVIGSVAVMALALVALAAAALAARVAVERRLRVPLPPGAPFAGFDPGPWRPLAEALLAALLTLLAILPIVALAGTALVPALGVALTPATATLDNLAAAWASPAIRRAFANSLLLATGAALACTAIAVVLSFLSVTLRGRAARALDLAADAPFVVPGTVLGIAFILAYLAPLPVLGVSIYGTVAILALAYVGRFLPLVLRPVGAAMAALDPSLDEAARIAGISRAARMTAIALPATAPAAAAGAILVFLTAFNELTVSALLWSSGAETVGVTIFSMQYEGNSTGAAALSLLSLGFVGALVLVVDRLGRGLPPGALPWRAVA